jgi:hypothetical protein
MGALFFGPRYPRSLTLAELRARQQYVFQHVLICWFLRHYRPVRRSQSISI